MSGICPWDWFTAGEDMDVSILVLWWYGICDLMSLQLLCWVYPGRNRSETSQWSFLVKASWHAPLICPLTKEKEEENWTQLRTETLFKELLNWKRVLALDAQIFDSISATVSASSSSTSPNLSLRHVPVQRAGWRHFSFGWSLCNADASWWRLREKNSVSFIVKAVLLSCLWAVWFADFPGLCTDLK